MIIINDFFQTNMVKFKIKLGKIYNLNLDLKEGSVIFREKKTTRRHRS